MMNKFKGSLDEFWKYDPRLRKRLNREFGYNWISKGVLQQAFADVAHQDLTQEGFIKVRPGWYVRKATGSEEIFQCVKWQEFKGATAGLTWGVSLAFMPKSLRSGRTKWKRTLKSTDLDLVIGINNDIILNGEAPGQYHELYPLVAHGDEAFRHFTKLSWQLQKPIVLRYFEKLKSIEEILTYLDIMLDQPISNEWTHWHIPRIFCRTKLGRINQTEALEELELYYQPWETVKEFKEWAKKNKHGMTQALLEIYKSI